MIKVALSRRIRSAAQLSYRDMMARLRAYRRVRFTQGEKPIFSFINDLVQTTFLLPADFFRGFVPEAYEERTVIAFRQKLLRTTLEHDLAPGVMMMVAGSSHVFPARLPGVWRKALSDAGLRVHKLSVLFWAYVLLQKLKEAIEFYRYSSKLRPGASITTSYALLMGLPPRAYSGLMSGDEKVYSNFVHWFHQRHPDLDLHIVTGALQKGGLQPYVKPVSSMWPLLQDEAAYKKFRQHARLVLWRSFLALMSGHWEYMFMARDVIELHYMILVGDRQIPKRVALTNSHYIYRPLWSYNLEDRGTETGIYFYSTNTFNVELREGEYGQIYGYNLMSWSHYYTATPEQASFLKTVNPRPKTISVVGTIPLEDNGMLLPEKTSPVLAYFDVQPFRDAFMAMIGRPTPLYFYEASRRNLEDIVDVCKEYGFSLALKPKRDVGNRLCPRYKKLIEALSVRGDVTIIDSYIAAERVVAWADAVISQPFTSVAVVGKLLGKPSVYYDALCIYQKQQPAAQGQEVIQDRNDLSLWLQRIHKNHETSESEAARTKIV